MGSGRPTASSADQPKRRSMAAFQNRTVLSGAMMTVGTAEARKTPAKKEIALSRVKVSNPVILHPAPSSTGRPVRSGIQRRGRPGQRPGQFHPLDVTGRAMDGRFSSLFREPKRRKVSELG